MHQDQGQKLKRLSLPVSREAARPPHDRVETIQPDLPNHDFLNLFPEARRPVEHVVRIMREPGFKQALGLRGSARLMVSTDSPEFAMLCARHISNTLHRPITDILLEEPRGLLAAILGESGLEALKYQLSSKESRILFLRGIEPYLSGCPDQAETRTERLYTVLRDGLTGFQGLVIAGVTGEIPAEIKRLFPSSVSLGCPTAESTERMLSAELAERFGKIGKDLDMKLLGRELRGLSPKDIKFLVEMAFQVISAMRGAGVSESEAPLTTNLLLSIAHDDQKLRMSLVDPLR